MIKGTRYYSLDFIRAFAIVFVVFCHNYTMTISHDIGVFWYLMNLGVDLFFALSGFLIGKTLITLFLKDGPDLGLQTILVFLKKRWLRTIPLYLVFFGINFIVQEYVIYRTVILDWKYLFWLQNFTHPPLDFYGESWSLTIEEWFYVIFPLGLYVFKKKLEKNPKKVIALYIIIFISLITVIRYFFSENDVWEYSIAIFRLDSIAYGVLASFLFLHVKFNKKQSWALFMLSMFISLLGIYLYLTNNDKVSLLYYSLTGSGLALIVLSFRLLDSFIVKHFYSKIIVFISKVSYSLYLSNMIVLFTSSYFLKDKIESTILYGLNLIIIVTISYFSYNYIERPFIRYKDRLKY